MLDVRVQNQSPVYVEPEALRKIEAKAATIRDEMATRGYRPEWCEVTENGMIGMGFDMNRGKLETWTKAFLVDGAVATPEAFAMQIGEWRAKVRRDIVTSMASPVVQVLVGRYGAAKVLETLR